MKIQITAEIFVLLVSFGLCLGCTNSSLRLQSNGTLQICTDNQWKAVCSNDWGNLDTAVACRQLGYDGGYMYGTIYSVPFVDTTEYRCNGQERNLSNCTSRPYRWCRRGVNITCIHRNTSDLCNSGDVRLWGGNTTYEGNLEMCTDHKVWSVISDSSWSNPHAVVACRQLGFSNSIALPTSGSRFGQRYQPMEFGGYGCRGNEHTIKNCTISTSFVNTWSKHTFSNTRDYAGVRCLPRHNETCTNGDVRLTGGYSSNNGFAEICLDGMWAGVCQPSIHLWYYSVNIDSLTCGAMNYSRYTRIDETFFQLNRSKPLVHVQLDNYRCEYSSELVKLLDCVLNSSTYGISYTESCSPYPILCCPNDTCTIHPQKYSTPSTVSSSIPVPTKDPLSISTDPDSMSNSTIESILPKVKTDQREYSLRFDTMAASLISTNTVDLHGLEKDIQTKLLKCISDKYDDFTLSSLEDGVFYFEEDMLYKGKFSPLGDLLADKLILQLMQCIKKEPWIEYYNTDLRLHVMFEY